MLGISLVLRTVLGARQIALTQALCVDYPRPRRVRVSSQERQPSLVSSSWAQIAIAHSLVDGGNQDPILGRGGCMQPVGSPADGGFQDTLHADSPVFILMR